MSDISEIIMMIKNEQQQSNALFDKAMMLWDFINDEPEAVRTCKNQCVRKIQEIRNQLNAIEDEIEGV